MTTRHLLGKQLTRIHAILDRLQPVHNLVSVGRYRVLVWFCVVQVDEWVICTQSLCLLFDLCIELELVEIDMVMAM